MTGAYGHDCAGVLWPLGQMRDEGSETESSRQVTGHPIGCPLNLSPDNTLGVRTREPVPFSAAWTLPKSLAALKSCDRRELLRAIYLHLRV
jgi:hypothetical protein